jgi:hypothetical protein
MRTLFGVGTPLDLQGRSAAIAALLHAFWTFIDDAMTAIGLQRRDPIRPDPQSVRIVFVGSFA